MKKFNNSATKLVEKLFAQALKWHRNGKLNEAESEYLKVLKISPMHASTLCNLGVIRKNQGRTEEALALYQRALKQDQHNPDYLNNIGTLLQKIGHYDEAVDNLERAVAASSGHLNAWVNLSYAYFVKGMLKDAERAAKAAIAISSSSFDAWNNLGNSLYPQGDFDGAINAFRRSIQLNPDSVVARSNLLFVVNNHPNWSLEDIFAEYRKVALWYGHESEFDRTKYSKVAKKRLRVAYLSPDLRAHSLQYFLLPLIENHDRTQFEIYMYADQWQMDNVSAAYASVVDVFENVKPLSDEQLHRKIKNDAIDILLDMAGHTAGNRLPVFAKRAAPIQISYLGYGYTTGLDSMDYFISDQLFTPVDSEKYFSEKIYRLPRPQYAFRPNLRPDIAPLPAQKNGYVTFGCFSRSVRINYRVINTWANILLRVPNSRLLLNTRYLIDPIVQNKLWSQFEQLGISSNRIQIIYESPPWRAYTEQVDIALDPFPHNAGTTTFDALWMGCPVVTLMAHPAALGRFGVAILAPLQMSDWVAQDEEGYIQIAVEKSIDLAALAALRADLRERVKRSYFGDEPGLAHAIEEAYKDMWRKWIGD